MGGQRKRLHLKVFDIAFEKKQSIKCRQTDVRQGINVNGDIYVVGNAEYSAF